MYDLDDIRQYLGQPIKVRDVHWFTYWAVLHEIRESDRRVILTLRRGRRVALLVRDIESIEPLTPAGYRDALANVTRRRNRPAFVRTPRALATPTNGAHL